MHDWFFRQGKGKGLVDWLGVDAWIDSSIAQTWESLADRWNGVTTFFARFRLTGWKKLMNEAASEGLTMAAGGIMFAQPSLGTAGWFLLPLAAHATAHATASIRSR